MPKTLSRLALLLAVGLGGTSTATGCRHRALITSDPPGAEVRMGRRYLGVTPLEVEVWRVPFAPNDVRVNLPGRRWTEVTLSKWQRKSEHEVLLVRQHGRAGTWTPEDAEQ